MFFLDTDHLVIMQRDAQPEAARLRERMLRFKQNDTWRVHLGKLSMVKVAPIGYPLQIGRTHRNTETTVFKGLGCRVRKKRATQRRLKVPPRGVEQSAESSENTRIPQQGGPTGGPQSDRDPDLRAVIDAWPELPQQARQRILAIVHGT